MIARRLGLAAALALLPGVAAAHTQVGVAGGLISGFLHPILGLDHLIAMVAVGLWGAQLGRPLVWALPVAFPMMMAMGGVLGILGVPLPFAEIFIALSAVVLGAMVVFAVRAPVPVAVGIVAVFALFHGHAHGVELPSAANPLAYGIGFVVATGMLHLIGITIGLVNQLGPKGALALRGAGVPVAALGLWFLVGAVSA